MAIGMLEKKRRSPGCCAAQSLVAQAPLCLVSYMPFECHTIGRRERRCASRGAVDGVRWWQCIASFRWCICSSPSRGSSTSQAPTSSCAISKVKSWETCVFSSFFLLHGLTTLDWINRT